MVEVNWSQFEKNQKAKDISFESFCFQVAYILYKDYGSFEDFYNTPGSEFFLTLNKDCCDLNLKAGDIIGWQVKWWLNGEDNSSLTSNHRETLIENFKTTLKSHPDINKWIICTPCAFKLKPFETLTQRLTLISPNTKFNHWNKSTFNNFIADKYDKFNPIFNHYFNTNFIGFEFLKDYSNRRIKYLNKKYDTDLYTPSKADEDIQLLLNYKKIFIQFENKGKHLNDMVSEIEDHPLIERRDLKSFKKEYISEVYELFNLCVKTSREVINVISSGMNYEKGEIIDSLIKKFRNEYKELARDLNNKINLEEHLIDKANVDNYEIEFHQNHLLAPISEIWNFLAGSQNQKVPSNSLSDLIKQMFQKDLHILSSAGYGKTNIACNLCNTFLKKGIPALLILGSVFRKVELPQTIILEQLGLNGKYSFKELLQALNTLGFFKGVKIPIIIDGLNESNPYDSIWRSHIKDIIIDIEDFQNVFLVTTCRDRYIESIFEEKDMSKIPNTLFLTGLKDKAMNLAIKKYFIKFKIKPSSWNFNKALFMNPLLLRIFSETNQNKSNIEISLQSIFASIEKYITVIEERVSVTHSKPDPILRGNIDKGIKMFSDTLWEQNRRELELGKFHSIIDPKASGLNGSLTEKLLDEGLCFQKNISEDEEIVQFTFDLVGGFIISSKYLLKSIEPEDDICETLRAFHIEDKLFNKALHHPLHRDILMSLLHLLPKKFGVNLFELYDNDVVIEETINNLDYFIGNNTLQDKILYIISNLKKDNRNYRLFYEKLFEFTFVKEICGLCELTIKAMCSLNQAEIDTYWSELFRKNTSTVFSILTKINKEGLTNKNLERNLQLELYLSFLSTTSSDIWIRNIATENMFLLVSKKPELIIPLARQCLSLKDVNAVESVFVAMCGSVLKLQDKTHTINCLEFICCEFIPKWDSTHICIMDYIHTMAHYCEEKFQLDFKQKIRFKPRNFKLSMDKQIISSSKNQQHLIMFLFDVDIYHFAKEKIASIATDTYYKRITFSTVECIAILSDAMKRKGYREALFSTINSEINEKSKYRYGNESGYPIMSYSKKYLWQTYYEFVGYLYLSNKLKSENKNRFRFDYNYFDPTFPRLPKKYQLISDCFYPRASEDVQQWINSENQNYIDDYLIHHLYSNVDWVLLSADIEQKGKDNDTMFQLTLKSHLVYPSKTLAFVKEYESNGYIRDHRDYHDLFAGEIDWGLSLNNVTNSRSKNNYKPIDIMCNYTWTSWTSDRYQNPFFTFINPQLTQLLKLSFKLHDLSYYDIDSKPATKYIWAKGVKLYYMRKDLIDEVISGFKMKLILTQFVSKYGEYNNNRSKTLSPSYIDLKRAIPYSS